MKQSEIVTKIAEQQAYKAQNKVEQASNFANKTKIDMEIKRLKIELVESMKPKLRHGDYGFVNKHGDIIRFVCRTNKTNRMKQGGIDTFDCGDDDLKPEHVVGNFIDDIKAMQETVTELMIKDNDGTMLLAGAVTTSANKTFIQLKRHGKQQTIHIQNKQLPTLIRKLRQMEATLKREEAKR